MTRGVCNTFHSFLYLSLVLVRGIPTLSEGKYDWDRLTKDILLENGGYHQQLEILRVGWRTPRGHKNKRTSTMIMSFPTAEMADRVCEKGLFVNRDLHSCEYNDRSYDIKQCNNCGGLGHMQAHCRKEERCRKCHKPHVGDCPQGPPKCALCGGGHSAFWMGCPSIQKEKQRLKDIKGRGPKRHLGGRATSTESQMYSLMDFAQPHPRPGPQPSVLDRREGVERPEGREVTMDDNPALFQDIQKTPTTWTQILSRKKKTPNPEGIEKATRKPGRPLGSRNVNRMMSQSPALSQKAIATIELLEEEIENQTPRVTPSNEGQP